MRTPGNAPITTSFQTGIGRRIIRTTARLPAFLVWVSCDMGRGYTIFERIKTIV